MKRTLGLAAALVFGLASAVNAATVTMVTDSPTYTPGSVITLSGVVSVADTEADNAIFGAITVNSGLPAGVTPVGPATQFGLPGWATSIPSLTCVAAFCRIFDQVDSVLPNTPAASVVNHTIGTIQFNVGAAVPQGTVITFTWRTAPTSQDLDFFDVQGTAPGVTVTVIPEPTTAAMLGLGLFGLALAGRRRA